jgi:diguanylate cyclase (GGDEF)-like protein
MRVDKSFLRSAVARRVFWVLLAAAAMPLAVFALLAYATLADRLDVAARGRLTESAKYAGMRVYDRLVAAQTALAAMSAAGLDGRRPPGDVPLAAREIFRAVATVDHATGLVSGAADVATLWRSLLADAHEQADRARRLWWSSAGQAGEGRVLVGVRDSQHWWIGEVATDFLWGDLRESDSVVTTCVADARGLTLMCPPAVRDAGNRPGWRSVQWSLFTRGDFGTIDWVFTRSAAPAQLYFVDLPVEQVAWKAAAFSLLLVVGLALVLVRRTTVPLERLMDGTRRLAQRDWSARVDVAGGDEFGQLAQSFNDMAARVQRQMQALQVQAGIDREILSGLDPSRVLDQVLQRLQALAPAAQAAVLLAPLDGGRWQRVASALAPAAAVRMDPDLLAQLESGSTQLSGPAAERAQALLGLPATRPPGAGLAVHAQLARANRRTRALLLLCGPAQLDGDNRRELDELADRLAVLLAAAEREHQLRERAVHDSLTGLLNRAGLIDTLARRLQRSEPDAFVLAFIDLDGFKAVNDARGHPVGDALLCAVAELLLGHAGRDAVVARLGGDEFVLLLGPDRDAADALAALLCRRLAEPFAIGGQTLRIGASIGLVACPDDGHDPVELMRRADLAMYAAKGAGRARHAWFDATMDERVAARAWLQAELPLALQRGQLDVHFQPRVRALNGRLASVEALVRWRHPVRGAIAPQDFIPLAEETGLIEAVGRWVLERSCAQLRRWRDDGVAVPRVAVNVSALQLAVPGFAAEVLATVQRHGLQPSDLEVEITESLFAGDTDEVTAHLAPLREAGVLVALDDFGTGFSSLSSLYRLPVDVLKIDRSFVIDLGRRESADAVARSVVALARALGKHVVAEGVETDDQHRHLLDLGCDELQGYLFARPLPAAEVAPWLQRQAATA